MIAGAKKIILIDDDEDALKVLAERISGYGYAAESFTDPRLAVRQIRQTPPDLVITDVKMEGLNGFQVHDLLKRGAHTANVPIIMITGVKQAQTQLANANPGTFYYLRKPFKREELRRLIETVLDSAFDLDVDDYPDF